MEDSRDRLLEKAEQAPLTWDPVKRGKGAWVCFDDTKTYDLGPDPTGTRFQEISDKMLGGRYYPPDAIRAYGKFIGEHRPLRVGDRVLQQAPLFCKGGGPLLNSAVEIYLADLTDDRCRLGYVTTAFHYGRGIWNAELVKREGHLWLTVQGTASPNSWMFWLGLPVARWMQLRARRRAVEEFRSCEGSAAAATNP